MLYYVMSTAYYNFFSEMGGQCYVIAVLQSVTRFKQSRPPKANASKLLLITALSFGTTGSSTDPIHATTPFWHHNIADY